MRFVLLPLLVVVLAGCTEDTYVTSGAFKADRTQADMDDLQALADKHGAELSIMESFPEQFQARAGRDACDALYEDLKARDYLQSLSACRPVEVASDPDASTSSP